MKVNYLISIMIIISINSLIHLPIQRRHSEAEIKERRFFLNQFRIHNGNFNSFISANKSKKFFIAKYFNKLKHYYGEFKKLVQRSKILSKDDSEFPEASMILDQYGWYDALVSVGTPPQTFRLTVDTGSEDLYVIGKGATCYGSPCENIKLFNPNDSRTSILSSNNTVTLGYGAGSASGLVYKDFIEIGGARVSNFSYGVMTDLLIEPVPTIGFGPFNLSVIGQPNIVRTLYQEKQINELKFSLFLNKNTSSGDNKVIIGGVSSDYYTGKINFHPGLFFTGGFKFWAVEVSSTTINGQKFEKKIMIIDSGTPAIAETNGVYNLLSNLFNEYSCGSPSLPTINYQIGEITYSIPSSIWAGNPGNCDFEVQDDGIPYILGTPFLINYYSAYDIENHQIGFALAKN